MGFFGADEKLDTAAEGEDLTGLTLRPSLDNDAMDGSEVARILRSVADRIEGEDLAATKATYGSFREVNGNTVGFYQLTTDDEPLGRWPGGGPIHPGDL
ncbi:MAG TPA: hypothetical protein VHZ54_14375 [Solirubrobacterales bacterium]|jgi:hypothetical protein|nr:hypothetical protein [Solirubrobacterales bacterium]